MFNPFIIVFENEYFPLFHQQCLCWDNSTPRPLVLTNLAAVPRIIVVIGRVHGGEIDQGDVYRLSRLHPDLPRTHLRSEVASDRYDVGDVATLSGQLYRHAGHAHVPWTRHHWCKRYVGIYTGNHREEQQVHGL